MSDSNFLTICLNPVLQKTIVVPEFRENHVNRSQEYYFDVSGKGVNVSRALTQLGEKVIHLTQAGGRNRDLFLQMLDTEHIPIRWVDSFSEIRYCYTIFDKTKRTSTEIVEEAVPVDPGTENRIFDAFLELLPDSHAIIISGTKAAGFSDQLYPRMVEKAKQSGKIVVLDFREKDLKNSLPYSPDFIKPNLDEFLKTFFPEIKTKRVGESLMMENIRKKMKFLWETYRITSIVTNGSKPVWYIENGTIKSMHLDKISPLNTTGCGDAFAAGFVSEYVREKNVTKAIKKGCECGKRNALTLRPGYLL